MAESVPGKYMISVEEAKASVFGACVALETQRVALGEALGRVLAADVVAPEPVAPFDNAAMDGYALCWQPGERVVGRTFTVLEMVAAGNVATRAIKPGEAIQIMTGSPAPEGATVVLPVEVSDRHGNQVTFTKEPAKPGENIRNKGDDFNAGDMVLTAGTKIGYAEIALLAGCAQGRVVVRRKPRVAILTTGDELVEAAYPPPLAKGRIRNSNSPMVAAACAESGCEFVDLGVARDDKAALREALARASGYDALLTTGGVSMGEKDYVREALAQFGFQESFWKVTQRPAKPLVFGRMGSTRVFGLPGNPGSVAVCLEQYVKPALRRMLGMSAPDLPETTAVLSAPVKKKKGLTHFLRGAAQLGPGGLAVRALGSQSSSTMTGMRQANCFIVAPRDAEELPAGAAVTVQLLSLQGLAGGPSR